MKREVSLRTMLVATCALGALTFAVGATQVVAEGPNGGRVAGKNSGTRLRHAPAHRGDQGARRSLRARPVEPQWRYESLDHPVSSHQFWQQRVTLASPWPYICDGWSPGYCASYDVEWYSPSPCLSWHRCGGR